MSNETQPSHSGSLSDTAYTFMGAYLLILGVLSVFSNSFVIFVLVKGKTRFNKVHHALLLNLAITDLLISLIAYPFSPSSSFAGRWLFTDVGCVMYGFWVFCLAMGDMNTLTCIAISRYIVACKPEYNSRYIKFFLAAVWSHAVFWTGLPLLGWSKYTPEAYGTSCTINWYGRSKLDISYNVSIIFTCYVIHIGIFIYCYFHVIKTFKEADNSNISNSRNSGSQDTFNLESIVWYHRVISSRKVTTLSLAMVSAYMFSWTPYAVISIYVMIDDNLPTWAHALPTMLGKSSTLSNTIVYAIFSSKFRDAVRKLFHRNLVNPAQDQNISENQRNIEMTEVTRYRGHMTRNGVYIGQGEVALPKEIHLL